MQRPEDQDAKPVVVIRTIEELKALRTLRGKLSEFTLVLDMARLTAEVSALRGSSQ